MSKYEPVVGGLVWFELLEEGWTVGARHRHATGRLGDCGVDEYSDLTVNELLDVLLALVVGWSDPQGLQGWSERR